MQGSGGRARQAEKELLSARWECDSGNGEGASVGAKRGQVGDGGTFTGYCGLLGVGLLPRAWWDPGGFPRSRKGRVRDAAFTGALWRPWEEQPVCVEGSGSCGPGGIGPDTRWWELWRWHEMGRFWVVSKVELAGLGVKAKEGLKTSPGLGSAGLEGRNVEAPRGAGVMGRRPEAGRALMSSRYPPDTRVGPSERQLCV